MVLKKLMIFALAMHCGSALADWQKPTTPDGVNAQSIGSEAVRVNWNRAWDDVGVEGYNVYRNNQYFATVSSTNYIDRDVSSGSRYEYAIVAYDAAKNYTVLSEAVSVTVDGGSNDNRIATPTNEQSQDASKPTQLRAEVQNGNSAKLFWTAATGNVKGYNVYRDGSYVSSTSAAEYSDTQMAWGQDYRYQIVAYTHENTFSEKSDEIVVNTGQANQSIQNDAVVAPPPVQVLDSAPEGYNLVFSEEFRENYLDSSKWNTSYRWGPQWIINSEKQYYVDHLNNPDFGHSPFEFDGEHMTISAIPTPDHLRSSANGQPYLSGAMTTYNKFKMKYGYVEIRAKLPKGKGLWSAFWLLHQNDYDRRPEIDVVEYIGDKPTVAYNTYHYFDNGNLRSSPSMEAWGPDYSQNYHTYAVKWEPGSIIWYVDGVERNRFQDGNTSWEDMYLLVNLALGGTWAGDPDGTTPFPARMSIDYIRAYQKN
jgi:hypothetical protein